MRIKTEIYNLWHQLRKGIIQVFSASVINKIVVMLSNMVITRMLTKDEYGIWSYVLNIYSYAHLAMGLGLAAGALQFGAENRDKPEENQYYRYCALTGVFVNLPIILLFLIGTFTGMLSISEAGSYIRIYLPIIIFEYLIDLFMTILRCRNQFSKYSRLLTLNTVLVAVCTCAGSLFGVGGVVAGKYIAAILSIVVIVCVTRSMFPAIIHSPQLSKPQKRGLWHYSIFNGVSSALNRLLYLIDVSMVAALIKSTSDLANYKVATLIPNSLTFIPSSVIICILPNVVANNKNLPWLKKNVKKTFLCLLAVNVFISLTVIILAPFIISFVSGKQYMPSVLPFRVLVAGYCISGTFRALSVNVLAALKKVNFNVVCSLISCLADVSLNYFCITKFGMIGAAYATVGVECIVSVLAFSYLFRIMKKGSI